MVTKTDYGKREIEAGRSVLIELVHLLGEVRDSVVLVGGSVPPLLYPETARDYVGTLDVGYCPEPPYRQRGDLPDYKKRSPEERVSRGRAAVHLLSGRAHGGW
jgi:hypothetical protein